VDRRWIAQCLIACVLLVGMVGCGSLSPRTPVTFTTTYQAVLLGNNSVYFGKLSDYGTPNPVLTDVFYIISQTDPQTKQVKNILVQAGQRTARARSHVLKSGADHFRGTGGRGLEGGATHQRSQQVMTRPLTFCVQNVFN